MNKKSVYLFLIFVISTCLVACSQPDSSVENGAIVSPEATIVALMKVDTKVGDGAVALKQSNVAVHYSGWIYDDTKENKKGELFDTSSDLGEPLIFSLGKQRVIKGWDEGIVGMKVGGKRTLMIPAEMAYGSKRIGTARTAIPENSALVFDVELLQVN